MLTSKMILINKNNGCKWILYFNLLTSFFIFGFQNFFFFFFYFHNFFHGSENFFIVVIFFYIELSQLGPGK